MLKLRRTLGFWSSVAIAIGGMIGAGVFVLLGIGAGLAGSALPIAFLISGLLALCNAASASELGASFPVSGGTYEYARRLISPRIGFATGFIFSLSKVLETATVALSFGLYFSVFFNSANPQVVAIAATVAFTALSTFGIRMSGIVNNALVVIKVSILTALVALAAGYFVPSNFTGMAQSGVQNVMTASALLFFSYTGFARISTLGEEIKDPKRTIPRATLVALSITIILYLLISTVSIGAVGSDALANSSSPLAVVAAKIGPAFSAVVAFGALVATASVLLGDLLAASRTMFAMGRREELPVALGKVSRYGVPYVSQLAAGAIVIGIVAIGDLPFSAFLTSLTILFYYFVTNLSALKLKAKRLLFPRLLSAVGLGGCVLLALFIPLQEWAVTATMVLLGLAYYQIRHWKRA
jgi:basic amino acid/polyamine antiporter, APA family